jgi:hypothetical protein
LAEKIFYCACCSGWSLHILFQLMADLLSIIELYLCSPYYIYMPYNRFWFGLWCLMPLSTIFQFVVSFIGRGNRSTQRKPLTCHKSLTNFITYCCIEYTSPWTGLKLTTLVLIGIDCTGSCKSNYHTITTMMAPFGKCKYDAVNKGCG